MDALLRERYEYCVYCTKFRNEYSQSDGTLIGVLYGDIKGWDSGTVLGEDADAQAHDEGRRRPGGSGGQHGQLRTQ